MLTTNVGTNKGDGIVMATAVGADTTGLEIVQMMPSSSPVKGTMTDGIWGDASQQIWIDGEGNRFVNEYAERDVLTKASLALDGSIFYIIYAGSETNENGELLGASLDNTLFGTTVQNMVDNGHVWYGSTLAGAGREFKEDRRRRDPDFTEEPLAHHREVQHAMSLLRMIRTSARKCLPARSTSMLSKQIRTAASSSARARLPSTTPWAA